MALPAFGPLSFSQLNTELGNPSSAQLNIGSAAVRSLFGIPSGEISLSDGRPANLYTVIVSANQTNLDVRTYAIGAGWNQQDPLLFEINQGVIISGDTQTYGTPALQVLGTFPGGVQITNRGAIVGRGGDGGDGGNAISTTTFTNGESGIGGGRAFNAVTGSPFVNNLGIIAGGGGGGGGGAANRTGSKSRFYRLWGGSGGGGGRSNSFDSLGGLGGTAATAALEPVPGVDGLNGTYSEFGLGGTTASGGLGGNGGEWGAAGANGTKPPTPSSAAGLGGPGGVAITGNSNITWLSTGTILGVIE